MILTAVYNSDKKNSIRYDLYIGEDRTKIVGSIYWPKDKGIMPKEFTIKVG